MRAAFYTFGCKVNQYETEVLTEAFRKEGFEIVPFDTPSDLYVINTCTVTAESDRKCRQLLHRMRQQHPHAIIAVTGCYAQTHPQADALSDADIVTGTTHRMELPHLVQRFLQTHTRLHQLDDIMMQRTFEPMQASGFARHTRANVKVQDGCDNFCSYCIIPYARGPVRSKPLQDAVTEAAGLLSAGYQEIVLTGIHLCSYGKDSGESLIDLLRALDALPGTFRLRLGSLEPGFFTDEVAQQMATLPHLCHHFHLSLQSGCDRTLKAMRRHYDTATFATAVQAIRRHMPDAMLTADVIVGFPGETEEDFWESCHFVQSMKFLQVHVFPYSRREGTRAATMPGQLTRAIKSQRAKTLTQQCQQVQDCILQQQVGKIFSVLFEMRPKDQVYEGYTSNYLPVHLFSEEDISLHTLSVQITGVENGALTACRLS